ncbi:response regulator [Halarcobacter ebronensis]|uniref:Response regulator n=1 Tax=Halarcobacter ebronensis TaxID=1462615 RepID=A0A4V1LS32_9BACT|nr:response regulator [Halarcobacter ebronensis]RXJ70288.1 response regulator [Halarcobacter ebronensis]
MNFKDFTILYVEDEGVIRSNVEKCLNYIFDVKVAKDGKEGLDIFHNNKIDLIITDIYMPQKDGISMMQDIKMVNPNIPCIITSAYDPKLAQRADSCNLCNYLSKPFDIRELLNNCLKALDLL